MKKAITLLTVLLLSLNTWASVSLPSIFSDHMVLQQNTQVTIWGWGKPGEEVTIRGSWDNDRVYTLKVATHSRWSADLDTPPAGGPYTLTIEGNNTIEIDDVLIGEVWLGSGQSNMEWSPQLGIDNAEEEVAQADFPEIRLFTVSTSTAATPQQHLSGKWVKCTPESMNHFSALMYFFGRELHQKLSVPVGLINSSWGGTPVEIWMPEYATLEDRLLSRNAKLLKPVPWGPNEPGVAYNAMIHPLIPFRIKGALWYQGEANTVNANHYARGLSKLIQSWRSSWGHDFSFYYVQIAPFSGYGNDNVNGAIVRDQQRKVLEMTKGAGMVVISDVGDLEDIHPKNKLDVGRRLAGWALNHDYGFTELPFSGPIFSSYQLEKDRIIIQFDYVGTKLVVKDGQLNHFEILDGDGNWKMVPAKATQKTVEINSKGMEPKGIRFAFKNDAEPNLFSSTGLPASCFEVILEP